MGKYEDITGQKFGRLTAIERVEDHVTPSGKHHTRWLCECDCEAKTRITVLKHSLKKGTTKSCGCLQKERGRVIGKLTKRYNEYDISGEFGIGYTSNGEEFNFDLEDYELIKDYCWYKDKLGYIKAYAKCVNANSRTNTVLLHRLIMNDPEGMVVDHINHDMADNKKANLRICTQHQNTMNCSMHSNNTSGIKGVTYDNFYKKWNAFITINRNKKNLGYFKNIEDAIKVRQEAEQKYFGEFAYSN